MLGSRIGLMRLLNGERQRLRKHPLCCSVSTVNAFSSACMGVWNESSRAGLSNSTVVHAYGPYAHHEACAFLSLAQAQALEAGIRNHQGMIEIVLRGSTGVVARLNQYLASHGRAEVVLTQAIVIQNMAFYKAEAGHEGFTCYLASVRVTEPDVQGNLTTQSFQVPLTVIHEHALVETDPNDWEHPAFFAHFAWLREQYGDISHIAQRPTFLWPALGKPSKPLSAINKTQTEHAFFLSRAAACRQFNPLQIVCFQPSTNQTLERGMVSPVYAVRREDSAESTLEENAENSWLLRLKDLVKHGWFGGATGRF